MFFSNFVSNDKSLLAKIMILSKLSEPNVQQIVNFKIINLAKK